MAAIPSIKGSVFTRAVDDLLRLVSEGQIEREEVDRRLGPGDGDFLDKSIHTSSWYDVQVYGRMLELLRDVVGNGRNEYLRQRGAGTADSLREAGLYQQLNYLHRIQASKAIGPEERFRAFGKDLRLLVSLHGSILNFGRQTASIDPEQPDRYVLEIADADPYPEPLCWTTDGFINQMAKAHDQPDLWTWSRPQQDLIRFRMTRRP